MATRDPYSDLNTTIDELESSLAALQVETTSLNRAIPAFRFRTSQVETSLRVLKQNIQQSVEATARLQSANNVTTKALGKYNSGILGAIAALTIDTQINNQIVNTKRLQLRSIQTELSGKIAQQENLEKVRKKISDSEVVSTAAREKLTQLNAERRNKEAERRAVIAERAEAVRLGDSTAIRSAQGKLTRLDNQLSDVKARTLRVQVDSNRIIENNNSSVRKLIEKYNETADDADKLSTSFTDPKSALEELTKRMKKNGISIDELNRQVQTSTRELQEAKLKRTFEPLINATKRIADAFNQMAVTIREVQQTFGVTAGLAAKLKIENAINSIGSYFKSFASGFTTAAVSGEEIKSTQTAFQGEFGGVLTSDAAANLAAEAKRLGVGASEMAKARRVFMTQTMGDTGAAKAAQDKFIGEFAKKGLTAKDAMAAIGQNSELLARNGTRFATSFARAAADAKKIGVDLSKIDQVGDNIIDNFEGFLESQAELGAMGFGFDTSKLAELAEGGDTGALMNELRSQLASTGKDITKLRRSEQLALSKSFGLSMEELQRMAGPTAGAGEATLSPEELQKDANKSLGDLVFRADTIIKLLGIISGAVAIINSKMLLSGARSIIGQGGIRATARNLATNVGGRVGRAATAIRDSRLGAAVGRVAGRIPGMSTLGRGVSAVGRVAGRGASVVGRLPGRGLAAVGRMGTLARIGTGMGLGALGGLAEAGGEKLKESGYKKTGGAVSTLGEVTKYAGIGMMFGPVGAAVGGLVGAVVGITKNFDAWKEMGSAVFGGVTSALSWLGGKIMGVGKWLFDAFMTLNPVSLISSLFSKGVGGTWDKVKSLNPFGGEKKGDDVVSKSGYGERTLVTPSGPIALNNNDNVIAYADDMISGAIGEGIRMLSYGALGAKAPSAPQVNIDLTRLEQKLDQVVRAIGSMEVKMDGNKVGKILVNSSDAATTIGVMRQNARATL